jgi:hypothetical protein
VINVYDATGDLTVKQRYASAVNTSNHLANRFSTNSLFNTSGFGGGQGALNSSSNFINIATTTTDPTAL